jgi:hypothetical protein
MTKKLKNRAQDAAEKLDSEGDVNLMESERDGCS